MDKNTTFYGLIVAIVAIAVLWLTKNNIYTNILKTYGVTQTETNYLLTIISVGIFVILIAAVYPMKKKAQITEELPLPPPPTYGSRYEKLTEEEPTPIITPPEVPVYTKKDIEKVFQETPIQKPSRQQKERTLDEIIKDRLLRAAETANVTINIQANLVNNKAKITEASINLNNKNQLQPTNQEKDITPAQAALPQPIKQKLTRSK